MEVVARAAAHMWPRLRALRNARFSSAVRTEPTGPIAVLSPHLDDAVIDCWSLITRPDEVEVVNIFTGSPDPGVVAYWDRVSGADDSAARQSERVEEDRLALDRANRRPANLGFLGFSYRNGRAEPSFAELDTALASHIPAVSAVYAPAALGSMHPDHEVVRAYALAMAAQGFQVILYADVPYCVGHGWPPWVTGAPPDPYLDVDVSWSFSLAGFRHLSNGPAVVRLSDHDAAQKLAAMRAYRTQFQMLDRGPIGVLSNPLIHRFEVFWPLRCRTTSRGTRSRVAGHIDL